jgi:multidrug resistance efflux pump
MGEFRTTEGDALPVTPRERRSRRLRAAVIVLGAATVIGVAGHVVHVADYIPATGYVTTEKYAEVRPATAGRVATIKASSGDTVKAGALLLELEHSEQDAALAQAQTQVRKAEAELAFREAERAEKRRLAVAQEAAAAMRLAHTRESLVLTRQLAEKGLAAGRALSEDEYKVKVAQAELKALQATDTSLDERQIEILRREVAARQQTVEAARARLDECWIRAPIEGRLMRYTFYVGEVVRPDTVLYEIFGGDTQVLKLRVPERYAAKLATNQVCRAELTSYDALRPIWFHGRVTAMRNVIEGEFQKAYRVAYCSFDADGRTIPPGATCEVEILVGRRTFWSSLFDG